MIFQTAMDAVSAPETVFRSVRNSITKTGTITWIAGQSLVLETATASADGSFGLLSLTATSAVNHLYIGNCHASINPDSVGLCQVYGIDTDAIVVTGGAAVGTPLRPNVGSLATVGSSTDGCLGITGGGTAACIVLIAPSGAATVASTVFVRAL